MSLRHRMRRLSSRIPLFLISRKWQDNPAFDLPSAINTKRQLSSGKKVFAHCKMTYVDDIRIAGIFTVTA
jgi:hypothetical protein